MTTTVDELVIKIGADTKSLERGMDRATKSTKKFSKDGTVSLKKYSAAVKKASTAVAKFGAAFVAAAGAMAYASKKSLEQLDKIAKSAKNVGLSGEAFQEFAYAADLSGVSVDLFQKSMAKLEKAGEDAKDGLATAIRAFEKMGISVEELRGASPEKLLYLVSDGMNKIKDPTQQAAIAMQIFGTRGLDMLEFLKNGSDGLKDLRQKARDLGIVFSNELLASAEKNNDKLNTMKKIVDVQWVKVWADLAPTIGNVSNAMAKLVTNVTNLLGLNDSSDRVRKLTEELKKLEEQNGKMVGTGRNRRRVNNDKKIAEKKAEILREQENLTTEEGIQIKLERLESRKAELQEKSKGRSRNQNRAASRELAGINREIAEAMNALDAIKKRQEEEAAKPKPKSKTGVTTAPYDSSKPLDEIISPVEKQRMEQMKKNEEERVRLAKEANDAIAADTEEMSSVLTDSVDAIGRSLAQAAYDGKLDFADMFKSIIAGAIKAQMQVALIGNASEGGITGGGGLLGGLFTAAKAYFGGPAASAYTPLPAGVAGPVLPARASGGRVSAGQPYQINELRREVFIPDVSGTIDPNPGRMTGGAPQVSVNVTNTGTAKDVKQGQPRFDGNKYIVDIILSDLETNGTISKRMGQTYGLSRKT